MILKCIGISVFNLTGDSNISHGQTGNSGKCITNPFPYGLPLYSRALSQTIRLPLLIASHEQCKCTSQNNQIIQKYLFVDYV